jgi:hypothetical protein
MTCGWLDCGMTPNRWMRHNMTLHALTHVPLFPFKCQFCHQSFNQSSNHKTHVERHHPNEPGAVAQPGGTPNLSRPPRPATANQGNTEHWKRLSDSNSRTSMRNSILLFGRKMREPEYNLTDRQGIKIVLRALRKSRLPGAKALRRHLKKLKKGGNLTWKGLMQEFD